MKIRFCKNILFVLKENYEMKYMYIIIHSIIYAILWGNEKQDVAHKSHAYYKVCLTINEKNERATEQVVTYYLCEPRKRWIAL